METQNVQQVRQEKPQARLDGGCNSVDLQWLLEDNQYRWGINILNRGGIPNTRPGHKCWLSIPGSNCQGYKMFVPDKNSVDLTPYHVVAVDGYIYAIPFGVRPTNYDKYRLKNIRFEPRAKKVYFEVAQQSLLANSAGILQLAPGYSVLMMQDGVSAAAFWDGEIDRHTIQDGPVYETPTGTWMKWVADSRLAVAYGNAVMLGDVGNPISFKGRLGAVADASGEDANGRGDFYFNSTVTGLYEAAGPEKKNVLFVGTKSTMSFLKTYIRDRSKWNNTDDFKTTVYKNIGTPAGRSMIEHAGLFWWFSQYGWLNADSAATFYISSERLLKDPEMAFSKFNLAGNLDGVCAASFENYLLIAVPSGDTLNAHVWVMDYTPASGLLAKGKECWVGVWTGIRPVEFSVGNINGIDRLFCASIDYQSIPGETTFVHVWEMFRPERYDSYTEKLGNTEVVRKTRIGCLYETKLFGDGMAQKQCDYIDLEFCQVARTVDLKVSVAGKNTPYREVMRKQYRAAIDVDDIQGNEVAKKLLDQEGQFVPQRRRDRTESIRGNKITPIESESTNNLDSSFSVLIQWCGELAIESMRTQLQNSDERSTGRAAANESKINIKTASGELYQL